MAKMLKLGAAAALFSASMMMAGGANAVAVGDACDDVGSPTFSWSAVQAKPFSGKCVDGDKRYSFEGTSLPDAWKNDSGGIDTGTLGSDAVHIVEFKELEEHTSAGDEFFIDGDIELLGTSKYRHISAVDLDTTVAFAPGAGLDILVEKYVYGDAGRTDLLAILRSVNGSYDVVLLPRLVTELWYRDIARIRIGELSVIQNSFLQTPEPGSLALLGLGLVGLGMARRRKSN